MTRRITVNLLLAAAMALGTAPAFAQPDPAATYSRDRDDQRYYQDGYNQGRRDGEERRHRNHRSPSNIRERDDRRAWSRGYDRGYRDGRRERRRY